MLEKKLETENLKRKISKLAQQLCGEMAPIRGGYQKLFLKADNRTPIFVAFVTLGIFFSPNAMYSAGDTLISDHFQENEKDVESLDDDLHPLKHSAKQGGKANDTGLKTWYWQDVVLPASSGIKENSFSNGELKVDSECHDQQVTRIGNQLKFTVNPTHPKVDTSCSRKYNMRAEIRTSPWNVRHKTGIEEWFGWSYTFGEGYKIDRHNQWLFFQVHPGIQGVSPQIEFSIIKDGQSTDHTAGEIFIVNAANNKEYRPTGITPKAGETLDLVTHIIYGNARQGLLQVWIDGVNVYNERVATVYPDYPWGGNAKWGIYKWPWSKVEGVRKSKEQGIDSLETFMGPLRIITRAPHDKDYLKNGYFLVAPRKP